MPKRYRKVVTYGDRSKGHKNPADKMEQVFNRLEPHFYYQVRCLRIEYQYIRKILVGKVINCPDLNGRLIPTYSTWIKLMKLSKHDLLKVLRLKCEVLPGSNTLLKNYQLIKKAV